MVSFGRGVLCIDVNTSNVDSRLKSKLEVAFTRLRVYALSNFCLVA